MIKKCGSATLIAIVVLSVLSIFLLIKYEKYNAEMQTINKMIKSYE